MLTVFFEGLEFYAHHGVSAEERTVGHRYSADLYMALTDEPSKDDIRGTVDYADAMQFVLKFSTDNQFRTVEALASGLANGLMGRYPIVDELSVKIVKLIPPAPFIVEQVGVEVTRSRDS